MADVFISYKKERLEAVVHLAEILEAHGYSVWFDVRGLPFGPAFGREIEKALRAANVVLVLWCGLSKDSDWVIEEANLAKKLGNYLPAHMEPDPAPLGYSNDQAIQLTSWTGSPNDAVLKPLFKELAKRTGKSTDTNQRAMDDIEQRWSEAGKPDFLGARLTFGLPSEMTLKRVFPAASSEEAIVRAPAAAAAPSAQAWQEVSGSKELADFDHFLKAFPDAPEAEECRRELWRLVEELKLQRQVSERTADFEALPKSGYDPQPIEDFILKYPGTTEAFRAAQIATEARERFEKTKPNESERYLWEAEAAVSILGSQAILPERAPHLQRLSISGLDDNLHFVLWANNANLSSIYIDPDAPSQDRRLSIADITPLKSLTGLVHLELCNTQIRDLFPLKSLRLLSTLDLRGTPIRDLSPLRELTALNYLNLDRTQVSDVSHVEHVKSLTLPNGKHRKGKRAR